MDNISNNEYIKKIQGQRIRACMQICGLTGKIVAEKLNYTPQHISLILNGKRNLTIDMAIKFANLFSEYMNLSKTFYDSIPCSELKKNGPDSFREESDEREVFTMVNKVDYRYLLGKTDYMTYWENFEPPKQETANYLFQEGIKSLLRRNGYDLEINYCPDITLFQNINQNSAVYPIMRKNLLDTTKLSKLTERETGYSIDMLPADIYQMFQDFSKAIINILERKLEKQKWMDSLHTTPQELQENINSSIPDKDFFEEL